MLNYKQPFFSGTLALLASFCLLSAGHVLADERILDYQSDVMIHADGNLLVTETIRVRAEGVNIRRGIYRDFPTQYTDRYGNHYKVGLTVLDVQRNGAPEPYHIESRSNGQRIYIGNADRLIAKGQHEYRLRFQTTRQVGFFEEYDELYWNVTGNGWIFPIDRASARIQLPEATDERDLHPYFYTGTRGADGKDAIAHIINGRTVDFETTRGLEANEGLTVAVGWPKGIVREPTTTELITYFLKDNGAALVLLMGLLVPMGWYLWAWNRYGRDPQKGVIIPRFKPPTGLTPAGCSYIRKMSFDRQAFASAIVSLGVKGYLEIHEDDGVFTLCHKEATHTGKASKGERAVLDALFDESTEIELDQENHKIFIMAHSALKKALKAEHLGRVFNLNSVYSLPAIVMAVVTVIIAAQLNGGPAVWIPFVVLSVVLNLSFLLLLRAPTPAGRLIMDEIEGFKMYLDTAEQDRLDRMQSPRLTPELFEIFLPFAFALGVENSWCDRFAREFPTDVAEKGGYHPAWYVGNHNGIYALGHIGSEFSDSFSTAISSASSPPGSASGSGGGGSSGGGGGGGGGGGW